MTIRAAIYARVSTAQQEPGTSLESQRAACLRLAQEIGADVVAEYQDVDSGAKENIPGLLALTDAASRREFDLVLVDHPDRFSRNLVKKVVLRRDLQRTGVEIRYATLRVEDTAEGRLMENMTAVIAEYERERITFRTNRGRYAKAQKGLVVGTGAAPFGYEYVREDERITNLTPDPVTAPVVQRIFRELLSHSTSAVAEHLQADHVPPPRGVRWHAASILKMARNPAYAGRAAYGQFEWADRKVVGRRPKDEWVYAAVPPLIDPTIWERVQETIGDRKLEGRVMLEDDPYVLRGTLRCGHCGGVLAAHRNNGIRYYTCLRHYPSTAASQRKARCELPSVRAEQIEELIIRSVRAFFLDTSELRATMTEQNAQRARSDASAASGLQRDIDRQQIRLSQIHELILDAEPNSASWKDLKAKARETQSRITRLEVQIEQAHDAEPISDATLATLEEFAADVRAQIDTGAPVWQWILRELRARIVVRTVDPEADEGGWKIGRRVFGLNLQTSIPTIKLLHRKNVFSNMPEGKSISLPLIALTERGQTA